MQQGLPLLVDLIKCYSMYALSSISEILLYLQKDSAYLHQSTIFCKTPAVISGVLRKPEVYVQPILVGLKVVFRPVHLLVPQWRPQLDTLMLRCLVCTMEGGCWPVNAGMMRAPAPYTITVR